MGFNSGFKGLRTSGFLQRHNADRPTGFIGQSAGTVSELMTSTVMLSSIVMRCITTRFGQLRTAYTTVVP